MLQALQDLVDVKSDRVVLKSRSAEAFISARTSRKEQPEALAFIVKLSCFVMKHIPEEVFELVGSMSSNIMFT